MLGVRPPRAHLEASGVTDTPITDQLRAATPEQRAKALAGIRDAWGPVRLRYCPIVPSPKQEAALRFSGSELFYGGAGGSGKTAYLLAAALQYADVPSYASLLIRKTYAELAQPDGLISLSHRWLGATPAHWQGTEKTWRFPSGSTLQFGYLEHGGPGGDRERYKGTARQFLGFDELTDIENEEDYTYLMGWLRRPESGELAKVPLRVRGAGNPGGRGHAWVRRRLVSEKTRHRNPQTRERAIYLPALMTDNPHLDVDTYRQTLANLSIVDRLRIEKGDWDVRPEGAKVHRDMFTRLPADPWREWRTRGGVRYWDLAGTKPSKQNPDPSWTVGMLWRRHPVTGQLAIVDLARFRDTAGEVDKALHRAGRRDGRQVRVWVEQEPGSSGKARIEAIQRRVLAGFNVSGDRPTGSKETRLENAASAAERGQISVVEAGWNEELFDELEAFPHAGHDDQVDCFSGGYEKVVTAVRMRTARTQARIPVRVA